MNTLEQRSTPQNRRRTPRIRVNGSMPVIIGRGEGTLIDLSLTGMRVRHTVAHGCGTDVRVSFVWLGRKFAARATVRASRMIALDGPTYESRLQFSEITIGARALLREFLLSLESAELRRAVENLRGLTDERRAEDPPPPHRRFIRCRFFSAGRWDKQWTRDAAQPDAGFTVPAAISEFELAQLCRSFERVGEDGRLLLRKIAEAMIATPNSNV